MTRPAAALHPAYFQVRFRTDGPVTRWPEHFAIITAYATTGEQWADARNREADERLHAELLVRGLKPIRITGYDPASGHAEPGWAVAVTLEEALEIGGYYLQDAIFTVENDTLAVVSCRDGGVKASLGSLRERFLPAHEPGA
jgi:hypothetical protein